MKSLKLQTQSSKRNDMLMFIDFFKLIYILNVNGHWRMINLFSVAVQARPAN